MYMRLHVHVIVKHPIHICLKMSHIMFSLLTLISGGGGDGGGVKGRKAARPVTADQVCATTFGNLTSLDIDKLTLKNFQSRLQ